MRGQLAPMDPLTGTTSAPDPAGSYGAPSACSTWEYIAV
jgi:hypothetical protein